MKNKTVLLLGQPNVGKSVIFCALTGHYMMISNYAGTTVEFTKGKMNINELTCDLIDAPGTYSLKATNEAEVVTVNLLKEEPSAIICVLDALNIDSGLHLLLEALDYNLPTIAVINRLDLSQKRGLEIDHQVLIEELGIPVISTVATSGSGLDLLTQELYQLLTGTADPCQFYSCGGCAGCSQRHGKQRRRGWATNQGAAESVCSDQTKRVLELDKWRLADFLTDRVRRENNPPNHSHRADMLVKPWPGIPIAVAIMGLMFALVIGLGMGIRRFMLLPFFRGLVFPVIINAVTSLVGIEWLRNVLIGEYGFLIKGLEWPFALVLPYVLSFYLGLSFLEDWGYLPRLGVLLDGLFKKFGLSGSAIIPLLLGYGCGIPAIMASRSLPSRKQRIIVSSIICFTIPCVSQTGAFIALLAERSIPAMLLLFAFSVITMILIGVFLDSRLEGQHPFTLMEVPELLIPKPGVLMKKVSMRVKHYIIDGAVPMLLAVMAASLLYELGILTMIGELLSPLISGWLRMPSAAVVPLILGIVRRELTVLPLIEMELTTLQFVTGAVIALLYVPCIAMVAAMAKEFGAKIAAVVFIATTVSALFIGGLIAQIGHWVISVMA